MTVNLKKGEKVNLLKYDSKLKRILVGLWWNENTSSGEYPIDCDAFALLLNKNKKLISGNDIIYHANLKHSSKAVIHRGDNLTGSNKNIDCEQIIVDLLKIPQQIYYVVFAVTIYQAEIRKQDFGTLQGARIRVLNDENNDKLCNYDLTDNYDGVTTVIVSELSRIGDGWSFKAISQGTADKGIGDVMRRYR